MRPVHTCAYVSPRHCWSCRKAHFRLRGLAWPVGSLTPQDDSTEFQFFILFLLSVQHFLVTPHVGAESKTVEPRAADPKEAKVAQAKVAQAKVAEAKVAEAKVAQAKVAEAKVAQAKVAEAKVAKSTATKPTAVESKPVGHGALDAAIVRAQTKDALIGLGWTPSIAAAAVAGATAALGMTAPLADLIREALRRCPVPGG